MKIKAIFKLILEKIKMLRNNNNVTKNAMQNV